MASHLLNSSAGVPSLVLLYLIKDDTQRFFVGIIQLLSRA